MKKKTIALLMTAAMLFLSVPALAAWGAAAPANVEEPEIPDDWIEYDPSADAGDDGGSESFPDLDLDNSGGSSESTPDAQVFEGTCGDQLTWKLTEADSGWELAITGTGSMYDYSDTTAPWFHSGLTKVWIENGVTSIGSGAFRSLSSLSEVTLPETLVSIGDGAFENCTSLSRIALPGAVGTIGSSAFKYCRNLESIVIPASTAAIGENAFENCLKLGSVTFAGSAISRIGSSVFRNCSALSECAIPSSVTEIGENAFRNCRNMPGFDLPDGLLTIGDAAFSGCSGINAIRIPDSVTAFGAGILDGCTNLQMVTLPSGLTALPQSTFRYCTSLQTVSLPSGMTEIGKNAFFSCTALNEIVLPGTVSAIREGAFSGCSALKSLELPEAVSVIESAAFDSSGLLKVKIPDGVTVLSNSAFFGCQSLAKVEFGSHSKLSKIEDYAFKNCGLLTDCVIPSGVLIVPDTAFAGTPMAEKIGSCGTTVRWQLVGSGENAVLRIIGLGDMKNYTTSPFASMTFGSVQIFDGVTSIGQRAFRGCNTFRTITIPETVIKLGTSAFYNASNLTEVKLPSKVTALPDYTFYGCSGMKKVDGLSRVKTIGKAAFYNCQMLETAAISETVTSLGEYAFYNCKKLSEIVIPKEIDQIPRSAYYGCSGISSVVIPENASSIGYSAFYGCTNLKEVTIPGTVIEMYNYCFTGAGIELIRYGGSRSAWDQITCLKYDKNTDATTAGSMSLCIPGTAFVHCTDAHKGDWTLVSRSTVKTNGKLKKTCEICGALEEKAAPLLEPLGVVTPACEPTYGRKSISCPAVSGSEQQGVEVVSIKMTKDGALRILLEKMSGVESAELYASPDFTDPPKVITAKTQQFALKAGTYYLRIVRKQGNGTVPEFSKCSFTVTTRALVPNVITASDVTVNCSSAKQSAALKAFAKANAKLTYKTNDSRISIDSKGVMTIPAGFFGVVKVTVTSSQTAQYLAASETVRLIVKQKAPTLSQAANLSGRKLLVKWKFFGGVSRYQVQYSADRNFKQGLVTKVISSNKTLQTTFTGMTKGKTCYVRMRSYLVKSGVKVYSPWSAKKTVKITK